MATARTPAHSTQKNSAGEAATTESDETSEFRDCRDEENRNSRKNYNLGQTTLDNAAGILNENVISAINKIQLTPFRRERPDVWFYIVESDFAASRITSDETKYIAVLKALDAETIDEITDVVVNPPNRDKYNNLKNTIIQRFSKSREKQVSRLLNELSLDNKKPSQLLRQMRDLAAGGVGDDVLHSLWINRMPIQIRPMLVMTGSLDLDTMAEMADRIIDTICISQVMATSTLPTRSSQGCSDCKRLSEKFQELQLTVDRIVKAVEKNGAGDNRRHDRGRRRSRSNTPSRNDICFFHRKFGTAAYKCILPCSFTPKLGEGN